MNTTLDSDVQSTPEKNITVYGFGRRLAATLIDAVLVFIISFFLVFIVGIVFGMIGFSEYFTEDNNFLQGLYTDFGIAIWPEPETYEPNKLLYQNLVEQFKKRNV